MTFCQTERRRRISQDDRAITFCDHTTLLSGVYFPLRSFQDPKISGAGGAPASQAYASNMVLLVYEICVVGDVLHTKGSESWSDGSEIQMANIRRDELTSMLVFSGREAG